MVKDVQKVENDYKFYFKINCIVLIRSSLNTWLFGVVNFRLIVQLYITEFR